MAGEHELASASSNVDAAAPTASARAESGDGGGKVAWYNRWPLLLGRFCVISLGLASFDAVTDILFAYEVWSQDECYIQLDDSQVWQFRMLSLVPALLGLPMLCVTLAHLWLRCRQAFAKRQQQGQGVLATAGAAVRQVQSEKSRRCVLLCTRDTDECQESHLDDGYGDDGDDDHAHHYTRTVAPCCFHKWRLPETTTFLFEDLIEFILTLLFIRVIDTTLFARLSLLLSAFMLPKTLGRWVAEVLTCCGGKRAARATTVCGILLWVLFSLVTLPLAGFMGGFGFGVPLAWVEVTDARSSIMVMSANGTVLDTAEHSWSYSLIVPFDSIGDANRMAYYVEFGANDNHTTRQPALRAPLWHSDDAESDAVLRKDNDDIHARCFDMRRGHSRPAVLTRAGLIDPGEVCGVVTDANAHHGVVFSFDDFGGRGRLALRSFIYDRNFTDAVTRAVGDADDVPWAKVLTNSDRTVTYGDDIISCGIERRPCAFNQSYRLAFVRASCATTGSPPGTTFQVGGDHAFGVFFEYEQLVDARALECAPLAEIQVVTSFTVSAFSRECVTHGTLTRQSTNG